MALTNQREVLVNESLRKANLSRRSCDHQVNERVLIRVPDPDKLEAPFEGPFTVTQVHVNGTVAIQRAPNVTDRLNMRSLKPHRSLEP